MSLKFILALQTLLAATGVTTSHASPLVDIQTGQAKPGDSFVVRGVVDGVGAATLVLRVDDGHSVNYATRVNEEHPLPPGPFVWHIPLAGAKTSGGRLIDANDLRRLMLFEASDGSRIHIESTGVEPAPKFPEGAVGYSLGMPDAPLIGGLQRMSPGDPRIYGAHPTAVRRPSPDPIVTNGVAGLERLNLEFPRGRAHVSLWLEDVGEWESLPHSSQRRVRVNGVDLLSTRLTAQQWIRDRYLAGQAHEASLKDDSWTAFGQYRGGLISGDVDVGDNGVTVELAGDGAASTYVSAVVIEPAGQSAGRDAVEAARRQWMIENFPVLPASDGVPLPTFSAKTNEWATPVKATITGGSGARVVFAVSADGPATKPEIVLHVPDIDGVELDIDLFAMQRRLDRLATGATLLTRNERSLRGDPSVLPIGGDEPRRYTAWVSAPKDAAPGTYHGSVTFKVGPQVIVAPLAIEVLPVDLPEPASPAGFYLDEAPHLTWFDATRGERGRQLGCDLATLTHFGVYGNAPGLATPDKHGSHPFTEDTQRAFDASIAAPWLAYAPLKRIIAENGTDAGAAYLADAMAQLKASGLPAPVWSLFDEPGNVGGGEAGAATTSARLRAAAPGIKLAGQFNNPHDDRFLNTVDVAIVNPGYGVDVDTIAALKDKGLDAWIYNTGAPRFTAGVWLWRTHASRYLQWHARMPTADPFDPTDGREGDVQIFSPMAEVCALRQDIDVGLIEMAEGLVDQRWLQWLATRTEPQAKALEAQLIRQIPNDWHSASKDSVDNAVKIRELIVNLARNLL